MCLIEALKQERSSQYLCLEASITFISRPHDVLDQILAPYSLFDAELRFDFAVRALMSAVLGIPRAKESTAAEELPTVREIRRVVIGTSAQINYEPDSESTYERTEALPQSWSCFGLELGCRFWGRAIRLGDDFWHWLIQQIPRLSDRLTRSFDDARVSELLKMNERDIHRSFLMRKADDEFGTTFE